jgi:hypothetical protein
MNVEKNAGIALLISCFLMTVTMFMHPAGGSIEHLLRITNRIIITHSIAIVAMPFCFVGFWGLTKKLGTENFFSFTAMVVSGFGLIAGMCAAAVNGLVLPLYIQQYKDSPAEIIESIKPILKYGTSLNHAFDFIFIGALCLSILFWSIAMLQAKKLALWLGYFGIALSLLAIVMLAFGFVFVSLQGFRVFVYGVVVWLFLVSVLLIRPQKQV